MVLRKIQKFEFDLMESPNKKQFFYVDEHKSFLVEKIRKIVTESIPEFNKTVFSVDIVYDEVRCPISIVFEYEGVEEFEKKILDFIQREIRGQFGFYFDLSPTAWPKFVLEVASGIEPKRFQKLSSKFGEVGVSLATVFSPRAEGYAYKTRPTLDTETMSLTVEIEVYDDDFVMTDKDQELFKSDAIYALKTKGYRL